MMFLISKIVLSLCSLDLSSDQFPLFFFFSQTQKFSLIFLFRGFAGDVKCPVYLLVCALAAGWWGSPWSWLSALQTCAWATCSLLTPSPRQGSAACLCILGCAAAVVESQKRVMLSWGFLSPCVKKRSRVIVMISTFFGPCLNWVYLTVLLKKQVLSSFPPFYCL